MVDVTPVWDTRTAAIDAYSSQFHQYEATRTTAIGGADFRGVLVARARANGALVGVTYGEAYYCEGPVGVRACRISTTRLPTRPPHLPRIPLNRQQGTNEMTTTDDRTDEADRSWWITVGDVMNRSPLTIPEGACIRDAVVLVVNGLANDLMVVGPGGTFAGLLAEGDILRRALPNREDILAAGGTVEDGYRTFVRRGGEIAGEPIDALVIRKPVLVAPTITSPRSRRSWSSATSAPWRWSTAIAWWGRCRAPRCAAAWCGRTEARDPTMMNTRSTNSRRPGQYWRPPPPATPSSATRTSAR